MSDESLKKQLAAAQVESAHRAEVFEQTAADCRRFELERDAARRDFEREFAARERAVAVGATLLGENDVLRHERDAARADLAREHEGRKAAVAQMQEHHSEMQQKLNAMSDAWAKDRADLERLAGLATAAIDTPHPMSLNSEWEFCDPPTCAGCAAMRAFREAAEAALPASPPAAEPPAIEPVAPLADSNERSAVAIVPEPRWPLAGPQMTEAREARARRLQVSRGLPVGPSADGPVSVASLSSHTRQACGECGGRGRVYDGNAWATGRSCEPCAGTGEQGGR